jgi:hypothetical protein
MLDGDPGDEERYGSDEERYGSDNEYGDIYTVSELKVSPFPS